MLNLNLIQHCANILGEILDFHGPADMKLSNYFREHGELGQKDRGEIAECIYGVIRRLRFLKKINEDDNNYTHHLFVVNYNALCLRAHPLCDRKRL